MTTQLRTDYESSRQWIDVVSRSKKEIGPFAPCVLIAGANDGDDRFFVAPVNDRSFDQEFKGQRYTLVVNGAAKIKPEGVGRVTQDWPAMARVNAYHQEFVEEVQFYFLRPSVDGTGFEFKGDRVNFSLGYQHWLDDATNRRFFDVVGYLDEYKAVREAMRKQGYVVALVGPFAERGRVGSDATFDYSLKTTEFPIWTESLGSPPIQEDFDRTKLQLIANPEATVEEITNGYEGGCGYVLSPADHEESDWFRVLLTEYGTYEVEITALCLPVMDWVASDDLGPRYKEGEQVLEEPADAEDFWAWTPEDLVLFVNRHDFDVAKSVAGVEDITHRQPFRVIGLNLFEAEDVGFPYLRVINRGRAASEDEVSDGNLGAQVKASFCLKVGRPEKLGEYQGRAKTLLEFRVYTRTEATEAAQRVVASGRITRFSREVDVVD